MLEWKWGASYQKLSASWICRGGRWNSLEWCSSCKRFSWIRGNRTWGVGAQTTTTWRWWWFRRDFARKTNRTMFIPSVRCQIYHIRCISIRTFSTSGYVVSMLHSDSTVRWRAPCMHLYSSLAPHQTPETGSGVVAFTDLAAQLKMQRYIYWYTFCHL